MPLSVKICPQILRAKKMILVTSGFGKMIFLPKVFDQNGRNCIYLGKIHLDGTNTKHIQE